MANRNQIPAYPAKVRQKWYFLVEKTGKTVDAVCDIYMIPRKGFPLHIQLTAVNVDGQWLVIPGLQGDPDFRLTLTLDQATQLYTMGVYGVRNLKSRSEALVLSNQFLNFLNSTKTYTRADHAK